MTNVTIDNKDAIRNAITLLEQHGYTIVPPASSDTNEAVIASFEQFWNAYGNKIDRKRTLAKWKRMTITQRKRAMDFIPHYLKKVSDVKYQKHPLTYLNSEIWNDNPSLFSQPLPPMPSPAKPIVCNQQEQQQPEINLRYEMERQRFLDMIDIYTANPKSACAMPVIEAYRNGTLKSLNITWHP